MTRFFKSIPAVVLLTTFLVLSFTGCNRTAKNDETPDNSTYHPEATPATQFERDLKYVREAHFTYVWIFQRKDGKEFTADDSEALRKNAPKVVDWVKTDQNRVIAGSNFPLEAAPQAALEKRFNIQDVSAKP